MNRIRKELVRENMARYAETLENGHKTKNGRIFQDGKFFRMRRGKLVEIPPEWVGNVATPQTIRKRASKQGNGRRWKRLKVMRKKK